MSEVFIRSLDVDTIENIVLSAYETHERVIFVFEISQDTPFSIQDLFSIRPIIDKFQNSASEKLEKIVIHVQCPWQEMALKSFKPFLSLNVECDICLKPVTNVNSI